MRVPDISATANYAASVFNPINNQRNEKIGTNNILTALHQPPHQRPQVRQQQYQFLQQQNEHIKLNNIPPTTFPSTTINLSEGSNNHYYREPTAATATITTTNTLAYASTADEFVQKALTSTPTEYYSENHFNDNDALSSPTTTLRQHYCCGVLPKQQQQTINPFEEDYFDSDANECGNTYKSFKDIFNMNKTFYEDCVRDFENINILRNSQDNVNDTDVDPIELINASDEYQMGTNKTTNNPFYEVSGATKNTDSRQYQSDLVDYPNDKEQGKHFANQEGKSRAVNNTNNKHGDEVEDDDDDIHDDDQSMIDLCSDTKSIYDSDERDDDEEDDFLTSASSSSGAESLCTPKHSFFPRGIINPNYPGFQHLAHTLSEHFITNSQSDSYDSEMSEYEMELSADSFESIHDERSKIELNTFNNNNTTSSDDSLMDLKSFSSHSGDHLHYKENNQCAKDLKSVKDGTNYSEDDDMYLVDYKGHRPSIDETNNLNIECLKPRPYDVGDLQSSLKLALTLLENQEGQLKQTNELIIEHQVSTTPDILRKNYNTRLDENAKKKKENRPDLLRGVSPQSVGLNSSNEIYRLSPTKDTITPVCKRKQNIEIKDEICSGLTPVDIIGDFGQEVEREFGLLVSGYRRLVESQDNIPSSNVLLAMDDYGHRDGGSVTAERVPKDKVSDATLSMAVDQIDSSKYLEAFNRQTSTSIATTDTGGKLSGTKKNTVLSPDLADDNAVDLLINSPVSKQANTKQSLENESNLEQQCLHSNDDTIRSSTNTTANTQSGSSLKPKYHKASYDDRQLPPVAIEYKRCQQTSRTSSSKKSSIDKSSKVGKGTNHHSKPSIASRLFHPKRNGKLDKSDSNSVRKREEAELCQFQQLISNKEQIINNSKYTKLSSWAQYLKNSTDDLNSKNSPDLISPSALEKFDAYKIVSEVDKDQLQQHLKLAKEIEKKRRSDREEIRRRLALGSEENCNKSQEIPQRKSNIQTRLQNDFSRISKISSDSMESCSTDSETCPKLSKLSKSKIIETSAVHTNDKSLHPYHGRPLSISCSNNNNSMANGQQHDQKLSYASEDNECDFFTKQAKLQIEARMALSQAKEMAHMQMEIERQNRRISPITVIIRNSLEKVGVQIKPEKRRVSRQMLTEMNIAQLQILVNSLHTHIEELNESLVNYLMERDDLHDSQDTMLADIEELTRYIGAKEHIAQQERISCVNRSSK